MSEAHPRVTPPSSPAPRAPSRELDAEIAERVMGWQRFPYILTSAFDDTGIVESWGSTVVTVHHCPPGDVHVSKIAKVPAYSTDISAAWLVVDALIQQNASVDVSCAQGRACCEVWGENAIGMEAHVATEFADTAPLAICLAALAALESPPRAPLEGE